MENSIMNHTRCKSFLRKLSKVDSKLRKWIQDKPDPGFLTAAPRVFLEFEWFPGGFLRLWDGWVIPGAARWRRLVTAKPVPVGLFALRVAAEGIGGRKPRSGRRSRRC
jgi:hypothetical protein